MPGFGECRNGLPLRFTALGEALEFRQEAWNMARRTQRWRRERGGIARGDASLPPSAGDLTARSAASGEPRTAVPRVGRPAPRRV
jgi:hypothetical protein